MAVGLRALLLFSAVDISVGGHGYLQTACFPHFQMLHIHHQSTTTVSRGLVQRWSGCSLAEHRVAGCSKGSQGATTPALNISSHLLPGRIPKSCRPHNSTDNSPLLWRVTC